MDFLTYVRSYRIYGIAAFDLFLGVGGTAYLWSTRLERSPLEGAVLAVPIGILTHKVFGIETTLNGYLGLN
jgi:hypothetical protein